MSKSSTSGRGCVGSGRVFGVFLGDVDGVISKGVVVGSKSSNEKLDAGITVVLDGMGTCGSDEL